MAMPQEGRVGGRMTGGNNTNTNSYSSNDGSNSSKNNNKKAISVDVESDNLYSVLGLPVGSTAAEIKVQPWYESLCCVYRNDGQR